ncbi:helix-turn-helix domain-containing protein [Mesorhizobium sp. BR115XR7A]|uniref:helix-turn-helix domain-containing protein n=1 Tax=Mesorhizobium sp. BR115XR7A TaxID=2876645 RepID=UPI001CCB02EE|nr:helix-turn-helix transcriptional regulator [Mesorhizobium sp. BR115XR7A]MBZ9907771.1 helix-turn-helix domain-containing protein [Mesorhizobium sp. BR115XR7A]MBZ9930428.1 helix-turn-helix domain-containing protein [Mesorhizobium sp. BR1-1-5]
MEMRKLVGQNFARLRVASGLTQEQVAERANISQQYVSGLERGKRNPTIETLQAIAVALGVSHLDLVRPVDQEAQSPEPPPGSST